MTPTELLGRWLAQRLPAPAAAWMAEAGSRLQQGCADRDLFLIVSQVSRRVPAGDLDLPAAELRQATAVRAGWDPGEWSLDQAARIYMLLVSSRDGAELARRLDRLCSAADVGELVAFYRGLPLYPDPPRHVLRAAEGLRSAMRVVFEAVAHRNPYPHEQFAETAWNQMVLKALFIGSRLHPIVGLDARSNPTLSRMLCDYAHERWAAKRPVSPELWRCVGPFASGTVLEDFRRVFDQGTIVERQAAALALRDSPDAAAALLLDAQGELAAAARSGQISWETLANAGA